MRLNTVITRYNCRLSSVTQLLGVIDILKLDRFSDFRVSDYVFGIL